MEVFVESGWILINFSIFKTEFNCLHANLFIEHCDFLDKLTQGIFINLNVLILMDLNLDTDFNRFTFFTKLILA